VQQGDDVLLRNVNHYYGGALGADWQARPDLRVGMFVGAGSTRTSVDFNLGEFDSNLAFVGAYARYGIGASYLKAAIQGGVSRNDSTRRINNNLAPGGLETATASYDGWYVSPELTFGHTIALGHSFGAHYTLTPSVQVRYLHAAFDGYTESGATANLTVGTRTVQSFEERAELKLTQIAPLSSSSALLIHLAGGAHGVQRVGGDTVDAVLLGQSIPFATPGKDNVVGGFVGAGGEYSSANVAVFVSGEYLALSDSSSVISGKGGLRVAF
jgi:outer membrane autotransporter protein